MLNYELTDINGMKTVFTKPLQMSIVSSEDAPADSFSAVFSVTGSIPEIYSVCVRNGTDILFLGFVDEQTEETAANGVLLKIRARSSESLLLDNEAMPCRYCMPSLQLIYERHLKPLGFKAFEGTKKSCIGELVISKGMSEWQVLKNFCEKFYGTSPYISNDMIVHTGENRTADTLLINANDSTIKIVRKLKRSAVISDIYARTYRAGGYEMHFGNDFAAKHGIVRKRYVNTLESGKNSILFTKKLLDESSGKYESYLIEKNGIIRCHVGDFIRMAGISENVRVSEIHYVMTGKGEHTRIYCEVMH